VANIQPYVRALYLRKMPRNAALPESYIRRDAILQQIIETLQEQLGEFSVAHYVDLPPIAENILEEMVAASAFAKISDEFAGDYYSVSPQNIASFRQLAVSHDDISRKAEAIGAERYFSDVFGAWQTGNTEVPNIDGVPIDVPASDRIVPISHNQRAEVIAPLEALIDDVRVDNESIDADVKDRLLGQLRAGQELMRAGSVRAYILYHTLIRGLIEIAARFRGRAIAVAAEKLIELIVEHIFEGTF